METFHKFLGLFAVTTLAVAAIVWAITGAIRLGVERSEFWERHDVLHVRSGDDQIRELERLYAQGWQCYDREYGTFVLIRERKAAKA